MLWLLQSNQITPTIYDFFKLLKTRMEKQISLCFIVPDTSKEVLDKIKDLDPVPFKVSNRSATKNYKGFQAKRKILGNNAFDMGLTYSDALLLDDLGGGNLIQTMIEFAPPEKSCGLFLQIPTALGSSEIEERIFHSAVTWAKPLGLPVIGYELLPLDTRWTLAATLPDGVIARTSESFDHLTKVLDHENLWLLPGYEASILSSVSTKFNLDGAMSSYHYRSVHKIPETRTVLYIPHNVAMIYEYQDMLRTIAPLGKKIHLMFSYGKDQVRGTYTQTQMIELVYEKELKAYGSYSFHDMNSGWEMMTADSILACSACFQTMIAQEKNIPSLIFDPLLPPAIRGQKERVNTADRLRQAVEKIIDLNKRKTEFGTIFMQLARSMQPHD